MSEKIPAELKSKLRRLADKYETADFTAGDPSQILRRYSNPREQELAAFITAQLSFGKREQFLAKVNAMFADIDGTPSEWLLSGAYKKFFPKNERKFYRFFSYADMSALCERLSQIIKDCGTLGAAVRANYEKPQNEAGVSFQPSKASGENPLHLVTALIELFPNIKCVSQDPKGACKKLHMFLRWMVRQNSPVDLGLWQWASAKDLLIPLDVHVMQEGMRLGLLPPNSTPSAKTAIMLTQKLAQIWPDDPTKGDFALFGLGINS